MTYLFVLSIFVSIWMTAVYAGRLIHGNNITILTLLLMSGSMTAVITHLLGLW